MTEKVSETRYDSDCEIKEPEISTIEINDDDEPELEQQEITFPNLHIDDTETGSGPIFIDKLPNLNETSSSSSSAAANNILFKIAFNLETEFNEFKNPIISALTQCFNARNLKIDFLENQNFLDISAIYNRNDSTVDQEPPLFTIATEPTSFNEEKQLRSQIPSYKRSISEILNPESKKAKIIEDCPKPKAFCFNCSGEHKMKDCVLPKNIPMINKNRKQHQSKSERYHIDIEQRFAHIKPGKLSEQFINAIGLRKGELPSFFYRMRVLGYPPGWLEDAKITGSGMSLFDSEGQNVSQSLSGDIVKNENCKYDIRKIHSFPGYNSHPGRGYFDDFKYQGVPPYDRRQHKSRLIELLGDCIAKPGYKRQKIKIPTSVDEAEYNIDMIDMEVDDEENIVQKSNWQPPPPPQYGDVPPPPPPLPSIEDIAITSDPVDHAPTPLPVIKNADDIQSPIISENQDLISKTNNAHDEEIVLNNEDLAQNEIKYLSTKNDLGKLSGLNIEEVKSDSPTIDDLEKQQRELLEALNTADSSELSRLSTFENDDSINEATEIIAANEKEQMLENNSEILNELNGENLDFQQIESIPSNKSESIQDLSNSLSNDSSFKKQHNEPVTPILPKKKSSILGTPVIQFSPYDNLPCHQNWGVGVSDVINFENLPDSTGKYEQMKKVISKVRRKITKLNAEDDL